MKNKRILSFFPLFLLIMPVGVFDEKPVTSSPLVSEKQYHEDKQYTAWQQHFGDIKIDDYASGNDYIAALRTRIEKLAKKGVLRSKDAPRLSATALASYIATILLITSLGMSFYFS
jgi:ribosomal protein S20